ISQGRLEALLTFQTMICDLTGMDVSNASTLDEATSAAEALMLARRAARRKAPVFLVDTDTLPATKAVLTGRADALGIHLHEVDFAAEGTGGSPRRISSAPWCSTPGPPVGSGIRAPSSPRSRRPRRWPSWPPTCWR